MLCTGMHSVTCEVADSIKNVKKRFLLRPFLVQGLRSMLVRR